MTVFLPAQIAADPWEIVLNEFQANGKAEKRRFAQIQKRGNHTAGFIIAGWDDGGNLRWWDVGGKYDPWVKPDDRTAERPWMYMRLHDVLGRIERLRYLCTLSSEERYRYTSERVAYVGLVYWVHPEADYLLLDRYVRLSEGAQFPGSPSN